MRVDNLYIQYVLRSAISLRLAHFCRGVVADVGCGGKQYAAEVGKYAHRHLGLDHPATLHGTGAIDVFCTASALPLAVSSVDTVLCTEVLEHLEEPGHALAEIYRVLRPGGVAILTAPFIWHLHEEPRDFYRYSSYGLEYLFKSVGFDIVEIAPLNSFWATFAQLTVYKLHTYNRGVLRFFPVIPVLGLVIQACLSVTSKLRSVDRWPSHHIAVVRRPAP